MRSPGQLDCRNLPPLHPPNRPRAFRRGVRHLTFFGPKSPPRRGRKRGRISDGFPGRLGDDLGLLLGGSRGAFGSSFGLFFGALLGRPSGGRFGVEILRFGRPSWERKSSKNVGGLVKNQHFGLPLPSWFGEQFRSHLGTIFDPQMAPKSLPEGLPKRLRKGDPKKRPPRAPNGPQDPPRTGLETVSFW